MGEVRAGAAVPVARLVFRCYIRRAGRQEGRWVAHCIDLDLWASGPSAAAARSSLEDAIPSYVEAVLDTEDTDSIPQLLRRRAPWYYVLFWHLIGIWERIRQNGSTPLDGHPFDYMLPIQIGLSVA